VIAEAGDLSSDEDPVLAQRALSASAVGFGLNDRADTYLHEAARAAARKEGVHQLTRCRPPGVL